jgi:hypothetical protein
MQTALEQGKEKRKERKESKEQLRTKGGRRRKAEKVLGYQLRIRKLSSASLSRTLRYMPTQRQRASSKKRSGSRSRTRLAKIMAPLLRLSSVG